MPDGERLVADVYDALRHVLIEAKASADRPSVRMGVGQRLDYRHQMGTDPRLALLLPDLPVPTVIDLLSGLGIGVVTETSAGAFEERLDG